MQSNILTHVTISSSVHYSKLLSIIIFYECVYKNQFSNNGNLTFEMFCGVNNIKQIINLHFRL